MKKAKQPAPKPKDDAQAAVIGEVKNIPLDSVRPNDWNPNVLTPFLKESLKHGIENDGWLVSQALLIWGHDEMGKDKNIIIDGEHRWHAARELGFKTGPAVFLDGLTEAQAKALTVKMDAKRGTFDDGRLKELVQSISSGVDIGELAMSLGVAEVHLGRLVEDAPVLNQQVDPDFPSGKTEHVKMVQLFFDEAVYASFLEHVTFFSKLYAKRNVTDTVLEVLRHV